MCGEPCPVASPLPYDALEIPPISLRLAEPSLPLPLPTSFGEQIADVGFMDLVLAHIYTHVYTFTYTNALHSGAWPWLCPSETWFTLGRPTSKAPSPTIPLFALWLFMVADLSSASCVLSLHVNPLTLYKAFPLNSLQLTLLAVPSAPCLYLS